MTRSGEGQALRIITGKVAHCVSAAGERAMPQPNHDQVEIDRRCTMTRPSGQLERRRPADMMQRMACVYLRRVLKLLLVKLSIGALSVTICARRWWLLNISTRGAARRLARGFVGSIPLPPRELRWFWFVSSKVRCRRFTARSAESSSIDSTPGPDTGSISGRTVASWSCCSAGERSGGSRWPSMRRRPRGTTIKRERKRFPSSHGTDPQFQGNDQGASRARHRISRCLVWRGDRCLPARRSGNRQGSTARLDQRHRRVREARHTHPAAEQEPAPDAGG